ncbi:epimerase [Fulvitalea axinellae]|uniref:Epimerase n=1 Tax=Fulvitalea axinellae TaxID=1182444 RepID=A0AAU9CJE6_9BACT|nr:epimerase [Fulvitalea axinellae]
MGNRILESTEVLVTGGAGFIGSNLIEALLAQGNKVTCLDNFATGKRENIESFLSNPAFRLIEGDIRNLKDCKEAVKGVKYILHQAALGSVPRSINDPITSNEVNVSGFLNMLVAARDEGVKRMVYAASSSTYGDHPGLPKVEGRIGKPLSPYAVTKYVNELYADVFAKTYGIELIGLRYFNVFGRRQDPFGAYAAVIPKFVKALLDHESPVLNGDGTHSRDFTYVDNVVQVNQLACLAENPEAVNTVYNVACGENTDLNELVEGLKENLSKFDPEVAKIDAVHGPERQGDVKHSLASIEKAEKLLGYKPSHLVKQGLEEASEWYYKNLK